MELNKDQLHMLRHMLGINTPWDREPRPHRNYAAVNPGDEKFIELERLGAVENRGRSSISEYDCYVCTEAGKRVAMQSHKDIRHSKAKRRYSKFLSLRDCCPDLTFHGFLTDKKFEEIRKDV